MLLHKRADHADQKQKPQKIYTRYACHDLSVRDRGDHFKMVGQKNLANTRKHEVQCFAIYLAFA